MRVPKIIPIAENITVEANSTYTFPNPKGIGVYDLPHGFAAVQVVLETAVNDTVTVNLGASIGADLPLVQVTPAVSVPAGKTSAVQQIDVRGLNYLAALSITNASATNDATVSIWLTVA